MLTYVIKSQAEVFNDLTKEQSLCFPRLIMGGINFGWFVFWALAQKDAVENWMYETFVRPVGEAWVQAADLYTGHT
jgi:hypothetical protein